MFLSIFGSVEQGIIYAIMALGVYLTFRVLDFPDLTVDGSFVTGTSVAATMIVLDYNPIIATLAALVVGFIAGAITGLLNTKGKINPLLSGILMMTALYSINLRIMGVTTEHSVGRPNIPLTDTPSIFTQFQTFWSMTGIDELLNRPLLAMGLKKAPTTWSILFLVLILTLLIKFLTDWFLKTEVGLALRATGDNKRMIRSFSANTDHMVILGLGVSNALVAFSGALIAQYGKFSDISLGIGMIITGLASVIIGEAIFGTKSVARTTLAVVVGAIIYRIILGLALRVNILDPGDMKVITTIIVIIALVFPQLLDKYRDNRRKARRREEMILSQSKEAESLAKVRAD